MESIKKKLKSILLIDDDDDNNFIHKVIIKESGICAQVESVLSAADALARLRSGDNPSLIFLDINMPVLSGWDFLNEYRKLSQEMREDRIIIMLSSSIHPDDEKKVKSYSEITEYKAKPLTILQCKQLFEKYFDQ